MSPEFGKEGATSKGAKEPKFKLDLQGVAKFKEGHQAGGQSARDALRVPSFGGEDAGCAAGAQSSADKNKSRT